MGENLTARILRAVFDNDGISRQELARRLPVSQAGVTKIIRKLTSCGLIGEKAEDAEGPGRPKVALTLCREAFFTVGVRLNRQYIRVQACDLGGRPLRRQETAIRSEAGTSEAMDAMRALVGGQLAAFPDRRCLGIGLAVPGPFSVKEQKILLMSGFAGWERVPLREEMEQAFHLPVAMEHDALCGALDEYVYGDCRSGDLLFIAADRGVGAGILTGGRPLRGVLGTAGECGHMSIDVHGERCPCGNRGCLELSASTGALVRRDGGSRSPEEILMAAVAGESRALAAFDAVSEALAAGIVSLIYLCNPAAVVVSDTLALPARRLRLNIQRLLNERLLPDIARRTRLIVRPPEPDCILRGAGALVLDRLFTDPDPMIRMLSEPISEKRKDDAR